MLESVRKNKKYIFTVVTVGLFGIMGLLIIPVVRYIIKVANRYPKAFRWICFTLFAFICIYGFLFTREWDKRFVIICICIAITINAMNTNRRK